MKSNEKAPAKAGTKTKTRTIRRKPVAKIKPLLLPKRPTALAKLKFAKLGGDEKLAARLVNAGFESLPQMAMLPAGVLQSRVGDKLTKAEEKTLSMLHRNARRMATYSADRAVMLMQARSVGGAWLQEGSMIPDLPDMPKFGLPNFEDLCHCGCCDSIFSLKAYLFDLLDLLFYFWSIDLQTVERLLLRSFSRITVYDEKLSTTERDLDCDALNAPLPQARIACEVMQYYLQRLGKTENRAAWPKQFKDGLLRLILPQQVAAALIEDDPDLASRTSRFTFAKVKAASNLPPDFATAIYQWEAELSMLTFDLTGLDRATALLADNSLGMIGYEPDETFAARREATVRQWLVDYCDALRWSSGFDRDRLEVSLFISINSGACRTTTRLQELVTSVQQIVESIRSGEIARLRRPDLSAAVVSALRRTETLPLAETSWARFRDYETWLGYMYGWVYPENVLSPISTSKEQISDVLGSGKSSFGILVESLTSDSTSMDKLKRAYVELILPSSLPSSLAQFLERKELLLSPASFKKNLKAFIEDAYEEWRRYVDFFGPGGDSFILGVSEPVLSLLFPLIAGLLLNRAESYSDAHEWYRLLYDPATKSTAAIFSEYKGSTINERSGTSWLDEPFDPEAIANRRGGVWLKHTILAIVRNVIDWADDEFARGLPDTFQRAEELYELAGRTLQAPALQSSCALVQVDVINAIKGGLKVNLTLAQKMARPLEEVRSPGLMAKAGKAIHKAVDGPGSLSKKRKAVEGIIARTIKADHPKDRKLPFGEERARQHLLAIGIENTIFFQPAPDGGAGGKGSGPFAPGVGPFLPDGPIFPPPDRSFDGFIDTTKPKKDYTPPPSALFLCIPPNPVLRSLQLHIDTQLRKLQLCLDFTGDPQLPRVYDCDTYDAATGLINRPTATLDQYDYCVDQPRYRYSFLIEKARQYVDVAQRFGSILLQALQNQDNEAFGQLKARHAIEVAGATIELRRLGRQEARDGVEIAEVQKERADSQVDFWAPRAGDDIDNMWDSMSEAEQAGLVLSGVSAGLSALGVIPGAYVAGIGAGISATGLAISATGVGIEIGAPVAAVGIGVGILGGAAALIMGGSDAAGKASSTALTYASFERRFEEWKNQFELAGFDARIADLQVTVAGDRLAIAGQELEIALLQLSHAREELRFLQTKVTNAALYDWMVRVLSRDYRLLMQIAACVARMAQRALEFERQETVRIVTGDYWNIAQGALASGLSERQRRLGLLGAERLLTDLTKLDAFKLATEKRRLQISKTFSLARMMPIELVQFRDSGSITFNSLLEWFDDGFQGHYLRLIKCVRVSLLAIVPPIDGIHAMLHNTGESSVEVLENGSYVEKRAARNFGESIALDSAFNESGLFVLNYEDPMLLPFEGLGVQTRWTLELPRGNNRFNFATIADVFLTIEYTAEYSRQLEQDMRTERIDQVVYEDTAVPLRLQFPDLWYHLKNHREDATGAFPPFKFKFPLPRTAFAPNLTNPITVEHLTVLVSGAFALPQDQQKIENGLTIKKGSAPLHSPSTKAFGPGVAQSNSLMLSTRGGDAPGLSTHPVIGASQEWTLEFAPDFFNPAAPSPKPLIERITDVLLVITVKGKRA